MHNGDNNYNIDHIAKEKLECIGKLLDVMDVVEDVAQLFITNNINDETNETNDKNYDEQTQTNT